MNRSLVVVAWLVGMSILSSPAFAWDPDWEDRHPAPEPAPAAAARSEAAEPPVGIYLVTDRYVDDVVTRSGPVTVYATETVHEITGSYARVLESVGTGSRSDFDGAAFNGRAELTDGRAVAGTYYENYVRTDGGYIPVSVVFFQDDLEIARATRATEPVSEPAARSVPEPVVVAPKQEPTGAVAPLEVEVVPRWRWLEERDIAVPISVPHSPAPGPLADRAIDILRARRIAISFSDPGVVRWRFTGGEGLLLGPLSGDPAQPFVARWDRLPPIGGVWLTRIALDFTDGTTRDLTLRVTVRAPGLVE
jgi:hypothetical protein